MNATRNRLELSSSKSSAMMVYLIMSDHSVIARKPNSGLTTIRAKVRLGSRQSDLRDTISHRHIVDKACAANFCCSQHTRRTIELLDLFKSRRIADRHIIDGGKASLA